MAETAKPQPPSGEQSGKVAPAVEMTLMEFVRSAWQILEPATKLQENWHLEVICEYLTLIKDQQFRSKFPECSEGIIFNVPPRTMKSLLISIFFPAWVWTTNPERRFMFVSYSEKLSTQHSIYRRAVMESDWYKNAWRHKFTFSKDQNLKHHYENSARGAMFSTGMQSTATGMGGDVLIFDDPLNPEQALSEAEREAVNLRFDTTFRSRINDPDTGVKIIVMQRMHELDLTGHIISREKGWKHVSLPAIAEKSERIDYPASGKFQVLKPGDLLWEERLPRSFLDAQKIGMGSWAFAGQYQQNPAPFEGGIIKRNWIQFYRAAPPAFDFLVQSWDCTFTGSDRSDFVAGQVWGCAKGSYYMLPYRVYERLDFAPTKAAIKSCHALFPEAHAILIEDKANGPAVINELQKEIPGIVPVSPHGGKLSRAQAMAPLWEAGSVHLPDPHIFKLPWMEAYIHNLCTFPRAAHDDDMDATSQALIYMRSHNANGIAEYYRRLAAEAGR
jgi:predicted phage terminase large subunit-like protein